MIDDSLLPPVETKCKDHLAAEGDCFDSCHHLPPISTKWPVWSLAKLGDSIRCIASYFPFIDTLGLCL